MDISHPMEELKKNKVLFILQRGIMRTEWNY